MFFTDYPTLISGQPNNFLSPNATTKPKSTNTSKRNKDKGGKKRRKKNGALTFVKKSSKDTREEVETLENSVEIFRVVKKEKVFHKLL